MRAAFFVVTLAVLLAGGQCFAQIGSAQFGGRRDVVVFGMGNFTKSSTGFSTPGPVIRQSSRASAGGGMEYEQWWGSNGLSLTYDHTPTDSKLATLSGRPLVIWPISREEFDVLALHRFCRGRRVSPYVGGGIATTALYGGAASGADGQRAAAVAEGMSVRLSPRLWLRAGLLLDMLRASTYSDQTYTASRTVMAEPQFGLAWGFGSSPGARARQIR